MPARTRRTGVFEMSRAHYDELPARMNFTTLKVMAKSPLAYRHALEAEDEDSDGKQRGRAVHLRVLEPELFAGAYRTWPRRRAGAAWKAFKAQAEREGREVLTEKAYAQVLAMARSLGSSRMAAPYLAAGKREQTVLWNFRRPAAQGRPAYEVACKGRLDSVRPDCIVDVKTSWCVEPRKFGRIAGELLMYVQAAWYVDGLAAATGTPPKPFVIIAVETKAPHVVQVFELTRQQLESGRARYIALLDQLQQCQRDNVWEGYAPAPVTLDLPPWLLPADPLGDLIFPSEKAAA